MKVLLLVTLAVVALVTSCSKKEAPKTQESGTSSGNPVTAPVDYLGAAAKANNTATKTLDLVNVSQAIRMFEASETRSPKNLNELVEKGYLKKLPVPPTGMKFSYDASTAQVKLVPSQ
jgi:hypothetical protein